MTLLYGIIGLLGYTAIGGGIPAYYAWVDHHGIIDWEEYKEEQEAKGQVFDLDKLIDRTPIPPHKDFAAHPLVRELFDDPPPDAPAIDALALEEITGLAVTHLALELRMGWKMALDRNLSQYVPEDSTIVDLPDYILRCLEPHRPMMQSLAGAAERPLCQFPTQWEDGFATKVPHLSSLQGVAKVFSLDASAQIHERDADGAFLAMTTLLRMVKHLESEPSLIGHLVQIVHLNMAFQPLWEGLRVGIWDDQELSQLDELLLALDIESASTGAMEIERATIVHGILRLADHPWDEAMGVAQYSWFPKGLWYYNIRALCILFDESYFSQPLFPGCRIRQFDDLVRRKIKKWRSPLRPDRTLAYIAFPIFGGEIVEKSLQAEAHTRMARIAIALERYRLAHGKFPEQLSRLAPRFIDLLPIDPVTGKAFHFLIREDGLPAIWSVGINGVDEGGRTKRRKHGDWAWQYSLPAGHNADEYLSKSPIATPATE